MSRLHDRKNVKITPRHQSSPSSGTAGFFQTSPKLENSFTEDAALRRVFSFFLPTGVQEAVELDLIRFGSLVLQPDVQKWVANAEAHPPELQPLDTWGRRADILTTSEGWRNLKRLGMEEGIVSIGYENDYGPFGRVYQFLKYHIWSPSSAMTTCPSAMQDGAASLLKGQLSRKDLPATERKVFEKAYSHLVSRDPDEAWTSGQWMTERPGGSDVRDTETQATYNPSFSEGSSTLDAEGNQLGDWTLSGFKWFSSATDSEMAILLAREPSGTISAFYAPMRRTSGITSLANPSELNGIQIQRLKSKLGTKPLPTAELILDGTRAYLVGEQGKGVKTISTILNITRVHTAVGSVSGWGRGLAVSRAFSLVRSTNGRLLADTPAHIRTLAEQHVEYRAMMFLAFFSASLLGAMESSSPLGGARVSHLYTPKTAPLLLRLITPVAKALIAKAAIVGLAECMESLGGIGYLENDDPLFNIARMYRDINVNSIWEGTTNVLAHDLVRVLKGSLGAAVLAATELFVQKGTENWNTSASRKASSPGRTTHEFWKKLRSRVEAHPAAELLHKGRELARDFGWVVCVVLLGEDARLDGNEIAQEVFRRYVLIHDTAEGDGCYDWETESSWDRRIVFDDLPRERARL